LFDQELPLVGWQQEPGELHGVPVVLDGDARRMESGEPLRRPCARSGPRRRTGNFRRLF